MNFGISTPTVNVNNDRVGDIYILKKHNSLNHHQSDLNHYLHFVLIIDVAGESCDSKVVGIAYELVLINNKKMVDFKPKWIQVDRKGVDLKILID